MFLFRKAIPENRGKNAIQFFSVRDMHCQWVLTLLPKLVDMLLFSVKKTEFPFFEFPYFRVLPYAHNNTIIPLYSNLIFPDDSFVKFLNFASIVETPADPGGALGADPPAPKIVSNSCSFLAILREEPLFWAKNPYFEQILGLGPPGVKTPLPPSKLLDQPWENSLCL